MGISFRRSILGNLAWQLAWVLPTLLSLPGCGLLIDAIEMVKPIATDELQAICLRRRVQIGMSMEPLRPFVFPAVFTDEGVRVTGMDVEIVKELAAALSVHCGQQSITPVLHLVRFRDLFVLLNEGKLDLFVSSITENVPSPSRSGLAYSTPYFLNGGLGGITRRPDVAARFRAPLAGQPKAGSNAADMKQTFAGLVVAVQEGTSAHQYAREHLAESRLLLCDSLPAAFESHDPSIDVILGKQPVLQFVVQTTHKDWQQLLLDQDQPLLLTREHYAVAVSEESYRLRWFINHVLFQLEQSDRLSEMRRRWFEETYAFPRRAATEGLPFEVEKMVVHADQGVCRPASS